MREEVAESSEQPRRRKSYQIIPIESEGENSQFYEYRAYIEIPPKN
jgi:hypothetical protein